jgi:hypothetical protein
LSVSLRGCPLASESIGSFSRIGAWLCAISHSPPGRKMLGFRPALSVFLEGT